MGTINELNTVDTVADDDKLVLWKTQAGATRAITAIDAAAYFSLAGGPYQPLDELLTAIAAQGPNTSAGDFIQLTGPDTVRVRKLTVATYAALTAIPATFRFDDMLVYVASRAIDGDGGEGYWRFDAGSSATTNGGTILAPDAGSGRWFRLWEGPARSDWFYTPHPSTVQTTALQAFLNSYTQLAIDPGTVVSGPVTIPAGVTVTGTRDAILKFNTTSAAKHIELLGSNITLDGFTVDGSYTTNTFAGGYTSGHFGIYVGGTSGTNINNIVLRNLLVKNYGDTGIWTKFVNYKTVQSCEVTRCGYAGMQGLSTSTAVIADNYVYNIFPGDGSQNCYGITETSQKSPFERVAQYIVYRNNRIDDVVPWAGLDLHFAKNSVVLGNTVTNCSQGIAYEGEFGAAPPPSTGDNIIISDNVVTGWSGVSTTKDGQSFRKVGGIVCKGADTNYQGSSLTITSNNVTGMGDTRVGGGGAGAIYFASWDGVICSYNNLRDNYVRGISASAGSAPVTKLDCSHNVITNVTQDPTTLVCRGIEFYDVDGSGVNNSVTGLASGSERLFQTTLTRRFEFMQLKETLLENTTYYVRSDGNNNNIGTANTSGGAFLTVQGAIDHIAANVNTNGKIVTIQIANGTWTTPIVANSFEGDGTIIIRGDPSTPANVVISTTSAICFTAENISGRYKLVGLKFQSTTSGDHIWAVGPVVVEFESCDFGTAAGARHHISSFFGARVIAIGNYSITGGAGSHLNSVEGTLDIRDRTVTLTGTPAFSVAFAQAGRLAHVMAAGATFSGSATGVRFIVNNNGVVFTNNGGLTFFPGNAAGTVSTGGRYDASATDPENEIISATLAVGSAVALTTNVTSDVTTISLPAGKWRVTGSVAFDPGATTSISRMIGAINTTSATIPTVDIIAGAVVGQSYASFGPGATGQNFFVGEAILTLASTTTVYLIARATFTTSTLAAYGKIQAQRLT